MIKRIWKYHIPDHSCIEIELPINAIPRRVALQYNKVTMWVEVPENHVTEKRKFAVYATGKDIPANYHYIDTVFDNGYIWHVYEVIE
jgi:hypothetical protein